MAKTNKYKATITLALVSVGFFLSYPFGDSFAGGLISSACGAAMVGGLADWFAVSALFRRPLGVPFRTAIIPRNREKIFDALANTVERELLTGDNIRKTLRRYNLTELFTHYLADHDGADDIRQAFAKIISNILTKLNPDKIGRIVELVIKKNIESTNISPILADGIEWLAARGYDLKISEFAADQITALAKHQQMHELLVELLIEARRTYERGLVKRKAFNLLLNISPEEVARIIQKLFVVTLAGMKEQNHPVHGKIRKWLSDLCRDLRSDAALQGKVEEWKRRQLNSLQLRQSIAGAIEAFRQDTAVCEERVDKWVETITAYFDQWLAEIDAAPDRRAELDEQAKQAIAGWLEVYHGAIGSIVRESLHELSDDMLVEFIEEKVGDDLQMIRINGSVVGGLVGMFIFLVTYWLMR